MPLAKGRRTDAERAAEHCLVHEFGCVVTRRMKRPPGGGARDHDRKDGQKTTWKPWGGKVDIFHCDVVGKRADGGHVYTQATCGQQEAVRSRRRKLETIPWHESDTVLVLQMVETPDPANRARLMYHFRVHEYRGGKWTVASEAILVPRAWFKALNENDLPAWKPGDLSKPPVLF